MSGVGGMTPRGQRSFFVKGMTCPAQWVWSLHFATAGVEVTTVSQGCRRLLPKVESRPVVYGSRVSSLAREPTHTMHRPNKQRIGQGAHLQTGLN